MKIFLFFIVASCLMLFPSCANKQKEATINFVPPYLASLKGKPVSWAIQEWGIPSKEYKANGKTYLQWDEEEEVSEHDSWNKRVPIGVSPKDNVWHKDVRYQYFSVTTISAVTERGKLLEVKLKKGYIGIPQKWREDYKTRIINQG